MYDQSMAVCILSYTFYSVVLPWVRVIFDLVKKLVLYHQKAVCVINFTIHLVFDNERLIKLNRIIRKVNLKNK
jgi:hypothetical protein